MCRLIRFVAMLVWSCTGVVTPGSKIASPSSSSEQHRLQRTLPSIGQTTWMGEKQRSH